ncbi:MAG TPA: hypothetical protein VGQ62_04950, partial [Chloroflexota bacterium]|nr:hypothetical protein [Chloroflexota bacterium]
MAARREASWVCLRVLIGLLASLVLPVTLAFGQQLAPAQSLGVIARMSVRMTNQPAARTASGVLVALDRDGRPLDPLEPTALEASVDGSPTNLTFVPGRPSIALAAAFMLDSAASPQVRGTLANALADGLKGIDVNRDAVAIVSTSDSLAWEQATFTSSADALQTSLNQVILQEPLDAMVSLEQVAGGLRALASQQRETRVVLLFTNRPLASAASAAATLGTLRSFASDNGVQLSVVALAGAGGQGVAEALAEATPNGRVEYALNATNRTDVARRIDLLLAPVFGAHHFELPSLPAGNHTLSLGRPGSPALATASFVTSSRPVQIDSFLTTAGPLTAAYEISQPTWVQARANEAAPIDGVEWTVDGRATYVTSPPWALLLDPEQLGEGRHDLAARIISEGRAGPFLTSSIVVPTDVLRTVRTVVRSWGLIGLLLIANAIVLVLFVRTGSAARTYGGAVTEFLPTLRLNQLGGKYVAPELLHFPARGKLRVGYHPPYMDNQVGSREFSKLPYQDVRGDDDAVKDLSRHVGCIWRDPRTNDCFIQLGWPGPGEKIRPKLQSQVFHFGRPQDAAVQPFRLAHHDIVRLASGIEFVFYQVGLRDKATPESKKIGPFEDRPVPSSTIAKLN